MPAANYLLPACRSSLPFIPTVHSPILRTHLFSLQVKAKAYARAKAIAVSSGKGKAFAAAAVRRSNLRTQADVPRVPDSSTVQQQRHARMTGLGDTLVIPKPTQTSPHINLCVTLLPAAQASAVAEGRNAYAAASAEVRSQFVLGCACWCRTVSSDDKTTAS